VPTPLPDRDCLDCTLEEIALAERLGFEDGERIVSRMLQGTPLLVPVRIETDYIANGQAASAPRSILYPHASWGSLVAQTVKRLSLPIKHGASIELGFGQGTVEMPPTLIEDQPYVDHDRGLLTADLRQVLRTEILRNFCSATTAARLFSMDRRTLHRHLQADGRTFRQVGDERLHPHLPALVRTSSIGVAQQSSRA
jgi:hypothetical protein